MYQSMMVRLVRDEKDSKKDDKIHIQPNLVKSVNGPVNMLYNVSYTIPATESATGNSQVNRMTFNSTYDLYEYVEFVLDLLHKDESPFKNIQFQMPMMPTILISPKNLNTSGPSFLSYLDLLLRAWPTSTSSCSSNTDRSRLFDHEEDVYSSHY
jgi:hypothetical protein